MIDVPNPGFEVERARRITTDVMAQDHLTDDNDLLAVLRGADYLADDTLTGYLPAVLFTKDDQAELFVDGPVGVKAIAGSQAGYYYESVHKRMHDLSDHFRFPGSRDSGHIFEQRDGQRFFAPTRFENIQVRVRQGWLGGRAVQEEYDRLGVVGMVNPKQYLVPKMERAGILTECMREAAKWVGYMHEPPYTHVENAHYPRTLSFEEVCMCLKKVFDGLVRQEVSTTFMTLTEVFGEVANIPVAETDD